MRRNLLLTLLLSWAAGCATPHSVPPPRASINPPVFPPEALVMQRGILTARGRQFSLNGYVASSQSRGLRLILTEDFGGVMADVLVNPAGQALVLQAKPPFRPAWVERYIAADLRCIFGQPAETNCPVQMLSPTHFLIERRWYKLDLRTVEVKPGVQPAEMFQPTSGATR